MLYSAWQKLLPSYLNVIPVEYPGHGIKMSTPLCDCPDVLAQEIAENINRDVSKRQHSFALFGHSLGAALLWKVINYLDASTRPFLSLIIVSGRPSYQHTRHMPLKHLLTDEELIEALTHYNGTPKAILDNKNTLSFFLRILRNDFLVNDRLLADNPKKTTVPLLALYCDDDTDIADKTKMDAWSAYSENWLGSYVFAGGHFYFNNREVCKEMLQIVTYAIEYTTTTI